MVHYGRERMDYLQHAHHMGEGSLKDEYDVIGTVTNFSLG